MLWESLRTIVYTSFFRQKNLNWSSQVVEWSRLVCESYQNELLGLAWEMGNHIGEGHHRGEKLNKTVLFWLVLLCSPAWLRT